VSRLRSDDGTALVEFAWLGIILLVSMIIAGFVFAARNGDNVLLAVLILCSMNFLFESFLEVQAGIVFFCFWIFIGSRSSD